MGRGSNSPLSEHGDVFACISAEHMEGFQLPPLPPLLRLAVKESAPQYTGHF